MNVLSFLLAIICVFVGGIDVMDGDVVLGGICLMLFGIFNKKIITIIYRLFQKLNS